MLRSTISWSCYTDRHGNEKQGLGDCFTLPMQFLLYNIEQSNRTICEESQIFLQVCYHVFSLCNESCKELPLILNIIPQFNSLYATELTQYKSNQNGEPTGKWHRWGPVGKISTQGSGHWLLRGYPEILHLQFPTIIQHLQTLANHITVLLCRTRTSLCTILGSAGILRGRPIWDC